MDLFLCMRLANIAMEYIFTSFVKCAIVPPINKVYRRTDFSDFSLMRQSWDEVINGAWSFLHKICMDGAFRHTYGLAALEC